MTERSSDRRLRPDRRPMLYMGIAAVVLVVALVIALVLRSDDKDGGSGTPGDPTSTPTASTSDNPGPAKSLASFTGSGDKTTTSFEAAANWEVRWRTEADPRFTVELLDEDGTSRGQIVAAKKKTKGSVFVSEAGEFKLKVTASGDWSIRIVGKTAG